MHSRTGTKGFRLFPFCYYLTFGFGLGGFLTATTPTVREVKKASGNLFEDDLAILGLVEICYAGSMLRPVLNYK